MSEFRMSLALPADHPAYAGHFPGRPILPGVVMLDAAIGTLARRQGLEGRGQLKSAKFLSPVLPGDALDLYCTVSASGDFRFEIRCGERRVASGVLALIPSGP